MIFPPMHITLLCKNTRNTEFTVLTILGVQFSNVGVQTSQPPASRTFLLTQTLLPILLPLARHHHHPPLCGFGPVDLQCWKFTVFTFHVDDSIEQNVLKLHPGGRVQASACPSFLRLNDIPLCAETALCSAVHPSASGTWLASTFGHL